MNKKYRTKNNGNSIQCLIKGIHVGSVKKRVLCQLVELRFDFGTALVLAQKAKKENKELSMVLAQKEEVERLGTLQ